MSGSSTRAKLPSISGAMRNETPSAFASSWPRSSAVTMTICDRLDADVAQDERQDALADAAEPDNDEPAGKFGVDGALHGVRVLAGVTLLSSKGA